MEPLVKIRGDDFVFAYTAGGFYLDRIIEILADQRAGDWRRDRDNTRLRVRFDLSHNRDRLFLVSIKSRSPTVAPEHNPLTAQPAYIDHIGASELILERANVRFEHTASPWRRRSRHSP